MLLVLVLIMLENLFGGMLLRYSRTAETGVFFLNQFNRPLSILSVLIWPVVVILARRHWGLAIAAIVIYLACLPFFINIAAFAAIAIGAVVFAVVYMLPKTGSLIVGVTLASMIVAAPTIDHILPTPKTLVRDLEASEVNISPAVDMGFYNPTNRRTPCSGLGLQHISSNAGWWKEA